MPGLCLHFHLWENLVKEFHSLIIVDGKELVEVLLSYLVGDNIAIYDCGHLVFPLDDLALLIL